MQSTSLGKPTRYEQERLEAMLRLGCVACAQLGLWYIAECQHIVEGNRRLGHWYTLPVCPGHHRGVWTDDQISAIPPDVRVSIADGSKVFDKVYGTQRDLWVKVQGRLKLPAVWPSSKILPRREYVGRVDSILESPIALPEGAMATPTILPRGEATDLGKAGGEEP